MYAGILLTALVFILMAISVTKLLASEDGIPVLVNRRPSGDTFQPFNESLSVCSDEQNVTYLVSERRCVKNQELYRDCGFALVPETETSKFRLAASITHQNGNRLEQFEILDIDNSTLTNASVIAVNNTDQLISSSVCHITSLEVYRGRRQITEISHDGFSLSERGQVQIDQTELSYDFSEYKGELFRMALSCSGVGLPGSGCLFFKVIGKANVTNAKFNMTVKGTFDNSTDNNSEDNSSQTEEPSVTTYWAGLITPNNSGMANGSDTISVTNVDHFMIGGLLFYVILGASSGVFILLATVLILLAIVCCMVNDKRREVHTTQQVELQPSDLNLVRGSLHDVLSPEYDTIVLIDENYVDSENVYSEELPQSISVQQESNLEDQNLQGESSTYPATTGLRRVNSLEQNSLDMITFDTFKPRVIKKQKRPTSWEAVGRGQSTDSEATAGASNGQEQIYDTVAPITDKGTDNHPGYNRLSHPGYPIKKFWSPEHYKLAPSSLYSRLNVDDGSVYDVPRNTASTHSLSNMTEMVKYESNGNDVMTKTLTRFSSCLSLEGYYDVPKRQHEESMNSTDV